MFRWFFILLIGAGIAGGVAWQQGLLDEYIDGPRHGEFNSSTEPESPKQDFGDPLYEVDSPKPPPPPSGATKRVIVVDPSHVVTRYKQDVCANIQSYNIKDGRLLFIGEEVT